MLLKDKSIYKEFKIVYLSDGQPEYVEYRGVRKVEGLQDGLQPGLVMCFFLYKVKFLPKMEMLKKHKRSPLSPWNENPSKEIIKQNEPTKITKKLLK